MRTGNTAVRPPARRRAARAGGVIASALLAVAAAGTAGAAPFGDLAGGAAEQEVLVPAPLPQLGPSSLDQMLRELAGTRLALLEAAAPRLGAGQLSSTRGLVEPVALDSPIVSGLPWRSGAACGGAPWSEWRGRPVDTGWFGVAKKDWASMIRAVKSASLRSAAAETPQLILNLPLLPSSNAFEHAECASGAFDAYFREIGTAVAGAGTRAGGAVVRLGKEANRAQSPWGYRTAADLPAYRSCFRRVARVLKERAPDLKIEWTNGRRTLAEGVNPLDAYPGTAAVDIIGVHYYDNPKLTRMKTQAIWDRNYVDTLPNGGPRGLGTWLAAARARGKKLAVSEWGVWGLTTNKADNPFYVSKMYSFFKANKADLAYESYFNCNEQHELLPEGKFPAAGAKYRQLWSAGQ